MKNAVNCGTYTAQVIVESNEFRAVLVSPNGEPNRRRVVVERRDRDIMLHERWEFVSSFDEAATDENERGLFQLLALPLVVVPTR